MGKSVDKLAKTKNGKVRVQLDMDPDFVKAIDNAGPVRSHVIFSALNLYLYLEYLKSQEGEGELVYRLKDKEIIIPTYLLER